MSEFGNLLRKYRRSTVDPQRSNYLTLVRMANLFALEPKGYSLTDVAIGHWERGQRRIARDDRTTLLTLLTILVRYNNTLTQDDIKQLLKAGGYRDLDATEYATIGLTPNANSKGTFFGGAQQTPQNAPIIYDIYSNYLIEIEELLAQLGSESAHYDEAKTYQRRIIANIDAARRYGDTRERSSERFEILAAIDRIKRMK